MTIARTEAIIAVKPTFLYPSEYVMKPNIISGMNVNRVTQSETIPKIQTPLDFSFNISYSSEKLFSSSVDFNGSFIIFL